MATNTSIFDTRTSVDVAQGPVTDVVLQYGQQELEATSLVSLGFGGYSTSQESCVATNTSIFDTRTSGDVAQGPVTDAVLQYGQKLSLQYGQQEL